MGNTTTSEAGPFEAAWAACVRGILAHRTSGGQMLSRALELDPEHVPALALRGFALRQLGRRDVFPELDALLRRMAPASPREVAMVEALRAWRVDDGPRAAAILDAQLAHEPRDLLLAKLTHGLRFMLGDPGGMRASIERVLAAFREDEPGYGFLLGCHAFALEETGDFAAAERAGRRGVELEPSDVWGAHAVAHVLFTQRRHRECARWLRAYTPSLEGCTNLGGHVAWHEALVLCELGRADDALAVFDERVAIHLDRDYRDVSNATSLLFRLERMGVDVGDRYRPYARFAAEREGDHASPFADVHYVLALVASGRTAAAARFVRSMADAAGDGFDARTRREVGVPLARAIVDLFGGRALDAARALERLRGETLRLGGSHAQRRIVRWLDDAAREVAAPREVHP